MKKSIFTILVALSITSCSSVFNGGSQTTVVTPSNPDFNAKIKVTTSKGSYQSKLPATISASPSTFNDVTIEVDDECYERITVNIGKSVTPSYFANILIWPGFFIDALTGSMWKLDNQTSVPLQKLDKCSE